jgi:hypothetical protein
MKKEATFCKCPLLSRVATDPDTPITGPDANGRYSLQVTPSTSVEIAYCPFCGGHDLKSINTRSDDSCTCGVLKQWASLSGSALRYDGTLNEYSVPMMLFRHCPSCGKRLDESQRAQYFMKVDQVEIEAFTSKAKAFSTIEDFLNTFGNPDRDFGPFSPSDKQRRIYGMYGKKRQITYTRLYKSVDVHISLTENDKIELSFSGKYIGPQTGA